MVTFNRPTWIKYPVPYGTASTLNGIASISPFWCLASPRQPNGSGTYYQQLSSSDLMIYNGQIQLQFNKPGYTAKWGLQVTWENLIADNVSITTTQVRTIYISRSFYLIVNIIIK